MNILFVSEHAVHIGGIGVVIQQLCQGLQQQGHRCYLYTSQAIPAQFGNLIFDDVIFGPLAAPARWTDLAQRRANANAFQTMAAALRQWQIDLVHCHEIHRSLYTAGHTAQCPIVASSHGGVFHKRYRKKRITRAYRRFANKISGVTVLNSEMANAFRHNFGDAFEVFIVPNGIDDEWLSDQAQEPRKDILLCAGRLSRVKRFDLAIDAYAASKCRQIYPLVIAGEGEEEHALQDHADSFHHIKTTTTLSHPIKPNTICFIGYQTGRAKLDLFTRTRLLLHPADFEPFGIVLLEAMAKRALPVCAELATYRSQFPTPEFHLAYVPTFNAKQWAATIDRWSQETGHTPLIEQNFDATKGFAWSHVFTQYLDCYRAALAEKVPDALQ